MNTGVFVYNNPHQAGRTRTVTHYLDPYDRPLCGAVYNTDNGMLIAIGISAELDVIAEEMGIDLHNVTCKSCLQLMRKLEHAEE